MDNHILFFIIAGLLLAVLIGVSFWSARREKSQFFSNTFSTRPPSTPIQKDNQYEMSPSFVRQNEKSEYLSQEQEERREQQVFDQTQQEIKDSVKEIKIRLSDDTTTQTASNSHLSTYSLQNETEANTSSYDDFTELKAGPELSEQKCGNKNNTTQVEEDAVSGIVTLYVVAAEGQHFQGEMIVQNLETLGFEFGEHQIFHRHLNDSTSPALFSAANMMQPGVFDLNNLEQFYTVGVVFFMYLPSVGSDLVNLRLMIRTVESFAQAMGGFVLNDQQQLFDERSRQEYLLRVSQQ